MEKDINRVPVMKEESWSALAGPMVKAILGEKLGAGGQGCLKRRN